MPITDPVQLFQAVVARMNAEDWTAAAGLCDPVSLASFRRTTLQQFAPTQPRPAITVDQYLKMAPDMPREVAEYNVKQAQKSFEPDSRMHREFPTVESVAALRALEPVDFFAEWLYGRSPQRQLHDQAKGGAISKKNADALFSQPIQEFLYETVGFLPDGDRIAHVLYRLKTELPGPQSDMWLAVPQEEREFVRDTSMRGHPQMFLCRKQPDGGWLAVAAYGFVGGGMNVSFVGSGNDDEYEDDEGVAELSP